MSFAEARKPLREALPTVLFAVADDDGLLGIDSVIRALDRRGSFRRVVVQVGTSAPRFAAGIELAAPDHRLGIRSTSHAERTAATLVALEPILIAEQPAVVVIAGDDDATVATALTAAKLEIAVAHVGSGLRSWDWARPDEINRTVIDRLSDTLFTACADAGRNLRDEGVPEGRIYAVGNPRVDTVRRWRMRARRQAAWERYGVAEKGYTLVRLQEPAANMSDWIGPIAGALHELAHDAPVLFVLQGGCDGAAIEDDTSTALLSAAGVRTAAPSSFLQSLSLMVGARALVTDVGSAQEDSSALGVACFTALPTTPRTVTLTHGTNVLLGHEPSEIAGARPSHRSPEAAEIPLWDGHAGERIAGTLVAHYALAGACERAR